MTVIAAASAAVLLAGACSSSSSPAPSNSPSASSSPTGIPDPITVDLLPWEVNVVVGQKINVVLTQNQSAGETIVVEPEPKLLTVDGPKYTAAKSTLPGAPGTSTTVLTAKSPGREDVVFIKTTPSAQQTNTLTVNIT